MRILLHSGASAEPVAEVSREESREESAPLSHSVQLVVDVPDDEGPSASVPQPSARLA